jgi:hypothetical protein
MVSDQKHNIGIAQLISALVGSISAYVYYLTYNKNNKNSKPYATLVFIYIYFAICHPLVTYFLYSRICGNADTDIELVELFKQTIELYVFVFIGVYLILHYTPVVEYYTLLINKIKQYVSL